MARVDRFGLLSWSFLFPCLCSPRSLSLVLFLARLVPSFASFAHPACPRASCTWRDNGVYLPYMALTRHFPAVFGVTFVLSPSSYCLMLRFPPRAYRLSPRPPVNFYDLPPSTRGIRQNITYPRPRNDIY